MRKIDLSVTEAPLSGRKFSGRRKAQSPREIRRNFLDSEISECGRPAFRGPDRSGNPIFGQESRDSGSRIPPDHLRRQGCPHGAPV